MSVYVNSNTQTFEYGFDVSAINVLADSPTKLFRANVDQNNLSSPLNADGSINTSIWNRVSDSKFLDRLVSQNGLTVVETANNSVNGNIISTNSPIDGQINVEILGDTLKNELTYNPNTWAEWSKVNAIGDSTGLEFTFGASSNAQLNTNLKPLTKYIILYNIVSNTISTVMLMLNGNYTGTPITLAMAGQIGNRKIVLTTQSAITTNQLNFTVSNAGDSGLKVKIKDIRIIEVPIGSQVDIDANSLTADQLALKYPFYSGIVSVGEYAGKSVTNLVTNGDFSNGTTGWSGNGSPTIIVSNNVLSFTAKAQNDGIYQSFTKINGHKYYHSAYVKANSNKVSIGNNNAQKFHSGSGNFELLSILPLTYPNSLNVTIYDGDASGFTQVQVKSILTVDLTDTFGAGNEPSQEWCDNNLQYFNGTIVTTDKIEVLSTGKNLFDKSKSTNGFTFDSSGTLFSASDYFISDYIRVKTGSNLKFSSNSVLVSDTRYILYDLNKTKISQRTIDSKFSVPQEGYVRVSSQKTNIDTFQVEDNSTATAYEPYKADKIDNLYISQPMRRLPSGTCDTLGSDGVIRRNIVQKIIQSSDVAYASGYSSYNNVDYYSIPKPQDSSMFGKYNPNLMLLDAYSESTDLVSDTTVGIGKFNINSNSTYILIGFPKGTALSQAQSALVGKKLLYQLATPIKEQTGKLLTLNSYANGSLQVNTSVLMPYIKERHTVNIDDNGDDVFSSCTSGLSSAVMIQVNMSAICSTLYGNINANLKSNFLATSDLDIFAYGQGDNAGAVGYGVNCYAFDMVNKVWINIGNTTGNTIARLNALINNANYIDANNNIYIMACSKYPSSTTNSSIFGLDYVNIRPKFTKVADVIDKKETITLGSNWMVNGEFYPNFDSIITVSNYKFIFDLVDTTNYINRIYFFYNKDINSFRLYYKTMNDEKILDLKVNFKKWESIRYLITCDGTNLTLRIKPNSGTIGKVSTTVTNLSLGKMSLKYGMENNNVWQADSLINYWLVDNSVPSDTDADNMLKGLVTGYENPNLLPLFNDTTNTYLWNKNVNTTSSSDGKTLSLNPIGANNYSYIIVPVMPNNKYEFKVTRNSSAYIDMQEYYSSNYIIKAYFDLFSGQSGTYSYIFTTSSKTSLITIYLTNSAVSPCVFSDVSLRKIDNY